MIDVPDAVVHATDGILPPADGSVYFKNSGNVATFAIRVLDRLRASDVRLAASKSYLDIIKGLGDIAIVNNTLSNDGETEVDISRLVQVVYFGPVTGSVTARLDRDVHILLRHAFKTLKAVMQRMYLFMDTNHIKQVDEAIKARDATLKDLFNAVFKAVFEAERDRFEGKGGRAAPRSKRRGHQHAKWLSTGKKVALLLPGKRGRRATQKKTVYRNVATGELRVRKATVNATTGRRTFKYVKF